MNSHDRETRPIVNGPIFYVYSILFGRQLLRIDFHIRFDVITKMQQPSQPPASLSRFIDKMRISISFSLCLRFRLYGLLWFSFLFSKNKNRDRKKSRSGPCAPENRRTDRSREFFITNDSLEFSRLAFDVIFIEVLKKKKNGREREIEEQHGNKQPAGGGFLPRTNSVSRPMKRTYSFIICIIYTVQHPE